MLCQFTTKRGVGMGGNPSLSEYCLLNCVRIGFFFVKSVPDYPALDNNVLIQVMLPMHQQ